MRLNILLFLVLGLVITSCKNTVPTTDAQNQSILVKEEASEDSFTIEPNPKTLQVGAARMNLFLNDLKNKKIALVVNQTSTIGTTHLADTLHQLGLHIQKIFAPEHGFRGKADAGEQVKNGKDIKTGIPIVSLYGKRKKPTASDMENIDFVVFDIQDVGARFYTYISTMHYVMESCAEQGIPFMVLDRPNPNGHYVDGPVLNKKYKSFVGMHSIPVVHGMTVGELAQMINGEGWLKEGVQCDLKVIPCEAYDHNTFYELPIKPSPNLPNIRSIYLYPSLCFFEGTVFSAGRGTNKQFQLFGHPKFKGGATSFTPKSMSGAKYPKHKGKICQGIDLSELDIEMLRNQKELNLDYLIQAYQHFPNKSTFFLENNFFNKLAGNQILKQQIVDELSIDDIRQSWAADLNNFKNKRKQYLLYDDFE